MKHSALLIARITVLCTLVFSFIPTHTAQAAAILYAEVGGVTSGSCTSWATACTLKYAISNAAGGDQVWVAEGVYRGNITLWNSITLYGGLPEGATSLSQQNTTTHPTILSGDVNGNDNTVNNVVQDWSTVGSNTSDNAAHVINTHTNATLDGFTVTAGYNGTDTGGGLMAMGSAPTLRNMIFQGNRAEVGGAIYYYENGGTALVDNVKFIGNGAEQAGAIYIRTTTMTITNSLFQANDATAAISTGAIHVGGAIGGQLNDNYGENNHPLTVTGTQFISNSADDDAGAVDLFYGTGTFSRDTFYNNYVTQSGMTTGGMLCDVGSASITDTVFSGNGPSALNMNGCLGMSLTNVTIANSGSYALLINTDGTLTMNNSIVYGNNSLMYHWNGPMVFNNSDLQGGCPGGTCTNVVNVDPLFVAAPNNVYLQATSPVIDAGDNSLTTSSTDVIGHTRKVDAAGVPDTGVGSAPLVDMGAYEFVGTYPNLKATQDNDVSGTMTVGGTFHWTVTIGSDGAVGASFSSGQTVLTDNLPTNNVTYGTPVPSDSSLNCSINGSDVLTCTAGTSGITIAPGSTVTVSIPVTPSAPGMYMNNSCQVDPGNILAESSETDNACAANSVSAYTNADLSVTNTDGVATGVPGSSVTYTITASNSGPAAVSGATVADTFPATLTGVTYTSVGSGGTSGYTASGTGNIHDTTLIIPSGGSVTYTVHATISSAATGTLSNTATISAPAFVVDTNTGNNSGIDTDTLTPQADLQITKTDGVTTVAPGGTATYTIVITNPGPSDAIGATVSDTLPAAISSSSFTAASTGTHAATGFTASGTGNLSETINLPANSQVTYTIAAVIDAAASGTLSNTATVAAPASVPDPTPGNNSATDSDSLNAVSDLTISKSHSGNFLLGESGDTYTITVTNSGTTATSGTVTVVDTLPTGLSATSLIGMGWSCTLGTLTCTRSDALSSAASYPPITLTVDVSLTASSSVTNSATVSGGGEANTANDTASDPTTILSQPNLTVNKANNVSGAVTYGGSYNWTITIHNGGTGSANFASGDILLTDTLPSSGASYGTVSTSGGSGTIDCSISGSALTCSANGAVTLAAGGSITITIPVTPTGIGSLNNATCAVDPNNVISESSESDNACSANNVTVNGAGATLHYNILDVDDNIITTARVGDPIHGSGNVSVPTGLPTPTGTLKLDIHGNDTCTDLRASITRTMDTAGSAVSPSLAARSFYYQITYSGDSHYTGIVTGCNLFESSAPTVTIDQATSQADPTATSPVEFTAVFSSAVTGFDGTDVHLTWDGTGTPTTSVSSSDNITFTISVSGMTSAGTLSASIPANSALDLDSNGNLASTSTDNTVTFAFTPLATSQAASDIIKDSATLNGTVNSQNDDTDACFEYGLDGGSTTTTVDASPKTVAGTTTTDTAVSAPITGLQSNTAYRFRVIAHNSNGTTQGSWLTFSTLTVSISTEIHNTTHAVITSAALDDLLHASATVTGTGGTTPTGDVVFSIYSNVNCSGTASDGGTVALTGGVADMGKTAVLKENGLSFRVHYNGDSNYPAGDGACTHISTSAYPTVLALSATTHPYNGENLTAGIHQMSVQFNMDVFHPDSGDAHSATNHANYLVVGPGTNNTFDTSSTNACSSGVAGDDTSYTVDSANYDASSYVATLNVNGGANLPSGQYRLYVCGSTSVYDEGNTVELNNGTDSVVEFTITIASSRNGSKNSKKSVATGFTPGVVSVLPAQPAEKAYSDQGLVIDIPSLGISQKIVGVPQTADGWDVSWLGNDIGYLDGTAFPTWAGNSVLTGHVTDADGRPGVFASLDSLKWGDQIIIHAFGEKYIYEVRTVDRAAGSDSSKVISKHEDLPWLTLITCRGYDEKNKSYSGRTVVRAVQVKVEE
jgi:LPXTG-site transpeptidase (sortase) family protein